MKEKHEIHTTRLVIAPLQIKDSEFILELLNSEGFIKFIGDRQVRTADEALTYVEKTINNPDINYWVVRTRTSGKMSGEAIGVVSFVKRDYLDFHDIGFAFLPRFYRQGYAYESMLGVLDTILDRYTSPEILANPNPENLASINLLKKLGLSFSRALEHEGEAMHLYSVKTDQLRIDALTRAFYAVFDNRDDKQIDWERLSILCIPEVRIICQKEQDTSIDDLASFARSRKERLANGSLRNFNEREIDAQTTLLKGIAQRHSRYEKSGIADDVAFAKTGQKFLQFVKIQGHWKISSFIWEDD